MNRYNYATVVNVIVESNSDEWKEELVIKLLHLIEKNGLSLIGDMISTKQTALQQELSLILEQSDITYKGHKITDQKLQLIKIYLDTLFSNTEKED
jgi:hypothetical protein